MQNCSLAGDARSRARRERAPKQKVGWTNRGFEVSRREQTRTELGAWFDRSIALDSGAILALRSRTAWAHDHSTGLGVTATFQSLAGSSFTEFGAAPARDSLLSSNVAEISCRNGISLAGKLDSELAKRSRTYIGTARLRYTF